MLITILATTFVLGLLVFIHELGHFLMAKRVGVRVEKFSLGFGPRLFGFKRGETEYMLSLIPLGGYVKLTGEDPTEEAKGEAWEFQQKTVWERVQIVAAGPVMNVILAYTLMMFVFLIGRQVPAYLTETPVISWIAADSPASRAGFHIGDQIKAVNGQEVNNWEQAYAELAGHENKGMEVDVVRRGQPVSLKLAAEKENKGEMGFLGLAHYIQAEVGALTPGLPASKADLKIGDKITGINGKPVTHWLELSQVIHRSAGQNLTLKIKRDDKTLDMQITPIKEDTLGIGLIGIQPAQRMTLRSYGLVDAVKHGVNEVHNLFMLNAMFLGQLLTGKASSKNIGGPIAIAQIAGSAAKSGMSDLLWFTAFFSLQLGVLNLFPIPILDGGLIFFLIIEAIMRKPVSLKKREIAQNIGLAMIIMLMVFAFYNDIMRWIAG